MDPDQGSSRSRKVLTYTKSLIFVNVLGSKFMFVLCVFSAQVHSQTTQSPCSQNVIQQVHFEFLISLLTFFSNSVKKLLRCSQLDNKQDEDTTPARLLSRRYVTLFTPHFFPILRLLFTILLQFLAFFICSELVFQNQLLSKIISLLDPLAKTMNCNVLCLLFTTS